MLEPKPLPGLFAQGRGEGKRGRELFKVGSEIIKESPSLEHGQYQIPSCSEQSDILQNEELNMVP